MLTLQQIEQQYPESLRTFKRNMLREYLQYKILEIIFASEFAAKLSLLGGTALRIIYGNKRFSEDLDFDNFGLQGGEFDMLAQKVRIGLENEGLQVVVDTVAKGAYRCNIQLPGILFANELSPHQSEKILIQIDSAAHEFAYEPDKKIINKFDVFAELFVTPIDILLAQKIYAAVNRKRAKGRDFFDIIFLLSMIRPNYAYLEQKIQVRNRQELKKKLQTGLQEIDLTGIVKDVEPFLFNPEDSKKIQLFKEYICCI